MVTASGDEEKVEALEAGADDFLTKPFDQDELLARVASLLRIKRYQDTIEAQADELARGTRSSRTGWRSRWRARADGPAAPLPRRRSWPSWSSTPATSRSSRATGARSRSCSATCAGSRAFAETGEPEEVMGVLGRVPRRARRPGLPLRGHARAVHRRRPDGLLQRPGAAAPTGRARAIRMAWRCAAGSAQLAEGWRRQGHDLALRRRDRPGLRHARPDRLRGPLDYAAIGSVTNLASRLCDVAGAGQILVSQRVSRRPPRPMRDRDADGELALRGFAAPARRLRRRRASTTRGPRHDGDLRRDREPRLGDLDEDERYAASTSCRSGWSGSGTRCGSTTTTSRWSSSPRSASTARRRPRRIVQAYEERFLFLLLLLRQPRLRMVYVTSMPIAREIVEYYLALLPGRDPEPCARAAVSGRRARRLAALAEREAPRAAAPARARSRR